MGFDGFFVPAVETKDSVSFGHRVPALDVGQFAAGPRECGHSGGQDYGATPRVGRALATFGRPFGLEL